MTMVPPRHYCVILNPVVRDEEGNAQFDTAGQAKLRHADLEIRLTQDPFPLYPGEEIQKVSQFSLPPFTFFFVCVFLCQVDEPPFNIV